MHIRALNEVKVMSTKFTTVNFYFFNQVFLLFVFK